jgi:hypothetical protein
LHPFEKDSDDFAKAGPRGKQKPEPDYDKWCEQGKKLAEKHSGYQWRIGDWILEGQAHFDPKNFVGDIPRYMLLSKGRDSDGEACYKSVKIPNYWKDVEELTGLATSTVKQYAQVARAYPKKKRLKNLGWSHHMIVVTYARRYEYLKACLAVPEGERPHSISWLCKLVAKEEGDETMDRGLHCVRIPVTEEVYTKLKDLAKYYGTDIAEVASVPFLGALEVFLDEQKKKVSLDLWGRWETKGAFSVWPFKLLTTRRQRATLARLSRRTSIKRDLVFSEQCSLRARAAWEKRRARRGMLITRISRLGIVALSGVGNKTHRASAISRRRYYGASQRVFREQARDKI